MFREQQDCGIPVLLDGRVSCSVLWDVCHHEWGRRYTLSDRLLTLNVHDIRPSDDAVSTQLTDLPVAYLDVACNRLTDAALRELLQQESWVETLDLEGNAIEFDPEIDGVNSLWR